MKPYYESNGITIYHGDCAEILSDPLLAGLPIITDPPYGVGVKYAGAYDDSRKDYWEWMRARVEQMREGRLLAFTHRVRALRELSGWDWVAVWNKPGAFGARIGNSPVLPHWEPIFLYGIHTLGTRTEMLPDVLTINPEPARAGNGGMGREKWKNPERKAHPCPKPIDLFARLIRCLTSQEQTILDPFCGSGVSLRAAKDTHRKAIGIEQSERYCEIAAERLSQEVLDFSAGEPAPTQSVEQEERLALAKIIYSAHGHPPNQVIMPRAYEPCAECEKLTDEIVSARNAAASPPQQTPTFGKIIGTCGHELTDGELDVQTIRKSQNRQSQPCVSYEENCATCRDEMRRRGELIEPETTKGADAWLRRQRKENPHV